MNEDQIAIEYEIAVNSAMDDCDPYFVAEALKIMRSKVPVKEQTRLIWKLFGEWKREISSSKVDGRANVLPTEQGKDKSKSEGVSTKK